MPLNSRNIFSRAPAEGGGRRTGIFAAILAHADAAVLLAQGAPSEAARNWDRVARAVRRPSSSSYNGMRASNPDSASRSGTWK